MGRNGPPHKSRRETPATIRLTSPKSSCQPKLRDCELLAENCAALVSTGETLSTAAPGWAGVCTSGASEAAVNPAASFAALTTTGGGKPTETDSIRSASSGTATCEGKFLDQYCWRLPPLPALSAPLPPPLPLPLPLPGFGPGVAAVCRHR